MSKKVYKASIIGCGMIAAAHAKMYAAHEKTELVAIADINPEHLAAFGKEWSIPAEASYPDHHSLFEQEELDLVSICTWHGSHSEIAVAAAMRGIPGILCEKPMATSMGEAKAMLTTARANGVKLTVEHNRRYAFENVKARELIAEGRIGKPQLVVVRTRAGLLNWATHVTL